MRGEGVKGERGVLYICFLLFSSLGLVLRIEVCLCSTDPMVHWL